jgi:DNA-binding NarL/FixJ family response regulator
MSATGGPPRVVLVDDHGIFRSGVRSELGTRVQVLGEADDVGPAIELIGRLLPDVVLLDVHLPGGGGHAVITEVKKEHPDIKFLALSASDAPEDVIAVIRAGARGYVTKTISTNDLADAIKRVADGDAVFSHRLAGFVLDAFAAAPSPDDVKPSFDPELDQLTTREREVLRLIAQGYTYKEIARELFISGKTVESHVSSVLRKLQLSSRHQLTRWAAERRLTLSQAGADLVVRISRLGVRISVQSDSWAPNLPTTPLTPRVPTRLGCTTTCSAGRTISRLTARSATGLSAAFPRFRSASRPSGPSWAGWSATWSARPASGSFSTSDPACPRRTTFMRSPSGPRVAELVDALPSGSYVFIHHLLDTGDPAAAVLQEQMLKGLGRVRFRTLPEVRALFGDLSLVEPGLVPIPEWRPDPGTPIRADYGVVLSMACAGVARKP